MKKQYLKIKKSCIEKLQDYLIDYVNEDRKINRDGKFKCFNSSCHNHQDKTPSASVVPKSGNRYWRCFACNAKGDIFKAVYYKEGIHNFVDQIKFLADKYNVHLEYEQDVKVNKPLKPSSAADNKSTMKKLVKIYYYENEAGQLVYKVERREWVEEGVLKKDFLPFAAQKNSWKIGLNNVTRVLYNLPKVLKAVRDNELIFMVEGEKCADKLEELGLISTTSFGGAKGWSGHSEDYVKYLEKANVVILPDNDEPGRAYGQSIAEDLYGTARSIKILELPGLEEKEDVVEWIEKGGSRELLLKIVQETPEYIPDESNEKEPLVSEDYESTETVSGSFGTVYEKDNCYYKLTKNGEKAISNFIIEPLYKIDGTNNKVLGVKVISCKGNSFEKEINLDAFNDTVRFRDALDELSLSYAGNVEELQYIRDIISDKYYDFKFGVDYIGFHKFITEWLFVGGDKTINCRMEEVPDVVIFDDLRELSTDILNAESILKEELKIIAPSMFNFNILSITATALGYTAGLFLKGKLAAEGIKYNHLLIEGQAGSGKSETISTVIAPILSMDQSSLNAGECTTFALNKAAASSNFVPLILDEYKPDKIGKYKVNLISNIMRNSYDSHRGIKGVKTLKKNLEFVSRASVILSGEVGICETANLERSLKLFFSKPNHNEERKNAMRVLRENKVLLNKFGRSLLNIALRKKDYDIAILHSALMDKVVGSKFKDERIRTSVANCILGLVIINKVFEGLELDIKECTGYKISELVKAVKRGAYEDLVDECLGSKSVLFQCLETMNRMAAKGELTRDYDYDTCIDNDGDLILRLNYTCFYDSFVKFCSDYHVEHEVLPLSSFKKQLSKADYCKCYNKPVKFRKRGGRYNQLQTYRSAVLYVKTLEENGLQLEILLSNDDDAACKVFRA